MLLFLDLYEYSDGTVNDWYWSNSITNWLDIIISLTAIILTFILIRETIRNREQTKNSELLSHFKNRLLDLKNQFHSAESREKNSSLVYNHYLKEINKFSAFGENFANVVPMLNNTLGVNQEIDLTVEGDNWFYDNFLVTQRTLLNRISFVSDKIITLVESIEFQSLKKWQRDYIIDYIKNDITECYIRFLDNTYLSSYPPNDIAVNKKHRLDVIYRQLNNSIPIGQQRFSSDVSSLFEETKFLTLYRLLNKY